MSFKAVAQTRTSPRQDSFHHKAHSRLTPRQLIIILFWSKHKRLTPQAKLIATQRTIERASRGYVITQAGYFLVTWTKKRILTFITIAETHEESNLIGSRLYHIEIIWVVDSITLPGVFLLKLVNVQFAERSRPQSYLIIQTINLINNPAPATSQ